MRKVLRFLGLSEGGCVHCGKPLAEDFVCDHCVKQIKACVPHPVSPPQYLLSAWVFGTYTGPLRSVLLSIKFHQNLLLARQLGEWISDFLKELIDYVDPHAVSFPPLNIRRYWSRGFNHVEEILRGAQITPISLFRRGGFDPPMAGMDKERRGRVVMSYHLKENTKPFVEGKRILLVDDILTTGATSSKLAQLLYEAGAREVHAFFVAGELHRLS
ncbi:amidophosphoribosyltransferase-like protein [Thermocrinis albus DSM 14484]|uniref:Amidophosphoribosyltransferase-like protein n=1 Tax=Thermocrinis albus (strain DSM 14484 / JCM 11386 / HI 11/12) TaxID=638303 RepID=D3SNH2_THEAH|nr:phosphoribosyltransferase family protein [Thermocrinis albus]ADC88709.1 amidophosphoribosyltransferase-like protein [Thermocrinis albus DSM 14484]